MGGPPRSTPHVVVALVGLGALGFGVNELSRVFTSGTKPELWSGLIALANIIGGAVVLAVLALGRLASPSS
ncbi:MAG: hypothetical protein ACNA8R_07735 [Nitriliruptoraceae bacterium]